MKVYRWDWRHKRNFAIQSTLAEYRRLEAGNLGISHTDQSADTWCHWLTTTGMDSWMIETDSPIPPDLGV